MNQTDGLDYIQTLVYDSEHCAATVEEAYEAVCQWLNEFESL